MSYSTARTQDALCCCEYTDLKSERSHVLACCCDCEAIDNFCDKCITCKTIPDETVDRMFTTIEDRCRLPWCDGNGAKRIPLDVAFPVIVVPGGLLLATYGSLLTVIVLISLPILLLAFYRNWLRRPNRKRTQLFYVWGLVSVFLMYCIYITIVVGFREVLLWETMLLTTLFFGMLYAFYHVKKDPGFTPHSPMPQDFDASEDRSKTKTGSLDQRFSWNTDQSEAPVIKDYEITWVDSRSIKDGKLETWCSVCGIVKRPRSGHCPLCNICIPLRDHHCVWIDTCVGAWNHMAFLVALTLCILTGAYGAHLTMTTICTPEMYFNWFLWPNDCRFVYTDFPTAMSFVSACYTYISIAGLCLMLIQQIVLISQNLTLQELHHAGQRGCTRFMFFAKNNVNNRGFLRNWHDFITGRRRQRYLQTSAVA